MDGRTHFSLGAGALRITSTGLPEVTIERIDGHAIRSALPFGDEVVVILDSDKNWGTIQNLVKLDQNGVVVWRAPINESMYKPNEYCSVAPGEPGTVIAHTWGGMRVVVDLGSGMTISETFVK